MKAKMRYLLKRRQFNAISMLIPLTLLLVLASVAIGLAGLVRQLEPWLSFPLAMLGVGAGWQLAKQRISVLWAGPIAILSGLVLVFVRVGRLGQSLWEVLLALIALPWQLWLAPSADSSALGQLSEAVYSLGQNIGILWQRLGVWLLSLPGNEPAFDPTAVTLIWSLIIWLVAVWAGWILKGRQKTFLATLPAGCVLAISLYFSGAQIAPLLWFMGGLLLLVSFTRYAAYEANWQEAAVPVSPNTQSEFVLTSTLMALMLVTLAALAPILTIETAVDIFERLTAERLPQTRPLVRSLGLNPAGLVEQDSLDAVRRPGMPRSQLIGAGPELAQTLIMRVQISAAVDNQAEIEQTPLPARYYWRSLTYDFYTGRGWRAGNTETINYAPNAWVKEQAQPGITQFWQTVQVLDEGDNLLYVAGNLLTVNTDFGVAWRVKSDGALVSDAFGGTTLAKNYRALSQIPVVSEAALRAEGSSYPAWIRERYLPLPENVPPHVLALARDLTATAPTPYDRAKAIEQYLRGFPYSLDVPAPPPNREIADFFLFDLQQGYCDYYATTMVVLARASGLPARLAVGFAQGTYDEAQDAYIVTALNAHSWVEIYFPTYGWIPFEPTAGLPSLERPTEVGPIVASETEETEVNSTPQNINWFVWLLTGLIATGLLITIIWGGLLVDNWRLARLSSEQALSIIYSRFHYQLNRLGVGAQTGDTPYQLTARFYKKLPQLRGQGAYWDYLLKPADNLLKRLITLFIKGQYSSGKLNKAEQREAIKAWQKLRWRLWLARLGNRGK